MTTLSAARLLGASAIVGAVGALGLVDPRPLRPLTRAAYRMGTAVVSGLLVADTTSEEDALLGPALDGVLTGGLTLGLMDLSEALDRRIIDSLRGLGMAHPRVLLAGIGAAGAAAMYLLPVFAGRTEHGATPEELFGEPETAELPEGVRVLISALLDAPAGMTDLPGAQALRDQLVSAKRLEVGFGAPDVQLLVEDPELLAVPRNQTWPVTGRFEQAGFRFEVELQIDAGMLGLLSIMVGDGQERLEGALAHLESPRFTLPTPAELTLRRESETP